MVQFSPHPISVSRRDVAAVGDRGQFSIVWLAGEHDGSTRLAVGAIIARASDLDGVGVLVDLSAVTFMDTSTVGSILRERNRLVARGLSLEIRAPSPAAVHVLRLCGASDLVREPVPEPAMAFMVHRAST
jgi:anti-anti-sigma factor